MSGLSEAELHAQAMRLVCEALADREQQGIEVDWDVIRQMHDQMDAMLQALQHKHRYDSSEIVDLRRDRDHWQQARQEAHEAGELMKAELEQLKSRHAALANEAADDKLEKLRLFAEFQAARAEMETLRKELANAKRAASDEFTERQVLTVEQQQDAAAWQQQVDSANKEVSYLRARLDEERSVSAGLRQQLDAAQAAVTLQRAGIERLQAFVEIMRGLLTAEYADQRIIAAAIAKLDDAGNSSATLTSSPTPVVEPLDAEGGA